MIMEPRNEILAAKKAKLAELRRHREERAKEIAKEDTKQDSASDVKLHFSTGIAQAKHRTPL